MDNDTRPTDPRQISFAPECFEQVGTRVEYVVSRGFLSSGPAVYTDELAAREHARRTGREVTVREVPVLKRIKWTV